MKFLMLVCVAIVVGCGGGGNTPKTLGSIEVHSDSTGFGVDGTHIQAVEMGGVCRTLPCEIVARPWPSYIAGAVNLSVGGGSTSDLLSGTGNSLGKPWAQLMQNSHATTVVIGLAINDAYAISLPQYEANLTAIAAIAGQNGKRVVLATPVCTVARVQPYIAAMRTVAALQGLQLIDLSANASITFGSTLPSHLGDAMHPDQTVYTDMGLFAARWL